MRLPRMGRSGPNFRQMIGLGLQYIGFCGEVGGDDLLVVCEIVGAVAAMRVRAAGITPALPKTWARAVLRGPWRVEGLVMAVSLNNRRWGVIAGGAVTTGMVARRQQGWQVCEIVGAVEGGGFGDGSEFERRALAGGAMTTGMIARRQQGWR